MSQTHDEAKREATYSTPRWVKVFGIIALVVVLLLVIGLLTGQLGPAGGHGPNLHIPPTEQGVQQP
jgi:ABC-type transporter Mla subunit MlaD